MSPRIRNLGDENTPEPPTLHLTYVALTGNVHSKIITKKGVSVLSEALRSDGLTVTAQLSLERDSRESYFRVRPLTDTYREASWVGPQEPRVGFALCELLDTPLDSRRPIAHIQEMASENGLELMCGMGLTYTLSAAEASGLHMCQGLITSPRGTFDVGVAQLFNDLGYPTEYCIPSPPAHTHVAFVPKGLLSALDQYVQCKWLTRSLASRHNATAFFSKPHPTAAPVHMSLWTREQPRNLFYDPRMPGEVSDLARFFIGGILHHFEEIGAILLATTPSGKLPPLTRSYSFAEDHCIVSAPSFQTEGERSEGAGWGKRCVVRGIDPDANHHLCVAAFAAAGMAGVKGRIDPDTVADGSVTLGDGRGDIKAKTLLDSALFTQVFGAAIVNELAEECRRKARA